MSEDGRQLECVADHFSLRRLYRQDRLFSGPGQRAACAVQSTARRSPYASDVAEALPGCCMFATGIITEGSENRLCSLTNGFCAAVSFKDPKVFRTCPSRTDQEKEHR